MNKGQYMVIQMAHLHTAELIKVRTFLFKGEEKNILGRLNGNLSSRVRLKKKREPF